jgi:hypothetical protein
VHIQIGKFILGSVLGTLVPISLAWAQYVHPLDFPKMPQLEKIPSDYLLHIPLGNSLDELEEYSEWVELKEEAYHSDSEMQTTNLNDLNISYEDFGMPDEFKNAKTSISSIQLDKPVLKHSSKSSDPELDHTFALTNLIESTLQHTASTSINNPIDTNWIESYHPKNIPDEIETYPTHPSVFIRNSLVSHIGNHGITSDKASDKQPTETLSYLEVLTSYPVFSGITSSAPLGYYNIFEANPAESFSSENSSPEKTYAVGSRQRRANFDSATTYLWEIRDFNSSGSSFDTFTLTDFNASLGTFQLEIVPLKSGSIGTGNDGLDTGSTDYGKPDNSSNSYNSYAGTSGFHFLNVTGDIIGTPSFNINSDAISYYLGHWYGDWGYYQDGNDFYLTYSAVPEPSTYFMTGALFCFIGCNRASRNAFKSLLSPVFKHWKTKDNTEDVQDRIS